MKKTLIAATVAVILGGGFAAYFHWPHTQPRPGPTAAQAAPPSAIIAPPKPEVRQVIAEPPRHTPLPKLSASDNFVFDALANLIANKSLMKFFHADRIVHNITATIDSLTYRRVPMSVLPVEPAPDKFLATAADDGLTISAKNAKRYVPYVEIAEAIDPKKLVELYVRLYPLFQQSYEDLGYPKKYFNDRLIAVLDNLLDAPDIKGAVKLVQPGVFYKYADPDLEGRSIGQRILVRSGSHNEAKIKSKLRAIRQELILHMHEKAAS
jgi:hypothetical protein